MIDVKTENLGRPDGVSCSMVDVFYIPGRLASAFGWLALLTAKTGTSVELSQATSKQKKDGAQVVKARPSQ